MSELGVPATVVFDQETHGPARLSVDEREGLRSVTVFPGESHEFFDSTSAGLLKGADNMVLPLDSSSMEEPLVDEIQVVSIYSLHVALYALQQIAAETGTPYGTTAHRALELIGTSGDCEEHCDGESLLPLPLDPPPGWDKAA